MKNPNDIAKEIIRACIERNKSRLPSVTDFLADLELSFEQQIQAEREAQKPNVVSDEQLETIAKEHCKEWDFEETAFKRGFKECQRLNAIAAIENAMPTREEFSAYCDEWGQISAYGWLIKTLKEKLI